MAESVDERLARIELLQAQMGKTLDKVSDLFERFVRLETTDRQQQDLLRQVQQAQQQTHEELAEWRAYRKMFNWAGGLLGSGLTLVLGLLIKGALGA